MFHENIDFNNLKIATLIRDIFFISRGFHDIFMHTPRFGEDVVGARGRELFLIGEILVPFFRTP